MEPMIIAAWSWQLFVKCTFMGQYKGGRVGDSQVRRRAARMGRNPATQERTESTHEAS
jgi:hypothetical protein